MREPLVAVRGEGFPETHELEGEHRGERPRGARRRGGPRPQPLARRRPGAEDERKQREGDEREVHGLREDEPAREETGERSAPKRRRPLLPHRPHREEEREDEARRLERLGEPVGRVGPQRGPEARPEDRETLPERARPELRGEQAGAGRGRRHEEHFEEDEERLRRPDPESRLPRSCRGGERDLDERQAHAVRGESVSSGARDAEVLVAGDADLPRRRDRDRRVEHLLLVAHGPERALLGRRREEEKNRRDRDGEPAAHRRSSPPRPGRAAREAPERARRTAAAGSVSTAKSSAPSRANPSSAIRRSARRSGSKKPERL